MPKMEQCMETEQLDDFAEKLEKAKQLYCLLNDATFGSEVDSAKSKIILQRLV